MPGMDGLELQRRITAIDPEIVVIMITAFASVETAVRALKEGAFDYITKPIDPDELSHLVRRGVEQRRLRSENVQLREQVAELIQQFDVEEHRTETKVYADFAPGTNIEALSDTVASVFDKPKKLQLQQAREELRGAGLAGEGKREQAVRRTIDLYLAAERSRRMAEMARKQVEAAGKLAAIVKLRVQEGRELALEAKRAELEVAKARQRVEAWEAEQDYSEASLAMVLGLESGQRARAALEDRAAPPMPMSAEEAAERALRDNRELRGLSSAMAAKNLEMRSFEAAKYPRLDLVAQYGLFARFNNYEDFFQKFQRHNGQLGISFQIPLWTGPATAAGAAAARTEVSRLQLQMQTARNRIRLQAEQGFQEVRKAETGRQVARLELEVAREGLTVVLAQFEEGRAGLQQVEQARINENEKWLRYYEAQHGLEQARFQLLERTGELMAAFR